MLPFSQDNSQSKRNKSNMDHNLAQMDQESVANPHILSIIYFQNFLSFELLQNQNLIAYCFTPKVKQETSWTPEREPDREINEEQIQPNIVTFSSDHREDVKQQHNQELTPQVSNIKTYKKVNKKSRRYRREKFLDNDQEYQPDKQGSGSDRYNKASQSKNVPKNFSKAILLFIKRQEKLTKRLVDKYGVDLNEFIKITMDLKGKINSIAQLRSLWMENQNKHAKIYRILSCIYIRKYSFQHIFNSRVENYSKHLKYRHKMLQVLQNPQQFRNMKDY